MSRWTGAYRCNRCLHTWQQPAGPVECPNCENVAGIKWLNFEKLREENPWHGQYPQAMR
jgi:hypothetical protein